MSVTEYHQEVGSWSLTLKQEAPQWVLDALDFFGHITITPGRVPVTSPNLDPLSIARYTGILRRRKFGQTNEIGGVGLISWLGDQDKKGENYETEKSYTAATFPNTIRDLLPASIHEGVLNSVAGTFTGKFQYVTPREAIEYVLSVYGAEYRVNPNGLLDAGTAAQLFVITPTAVIMRKPTGQNPDTRGIPIADADLERDVEDYTTRVLLLAEGEDGDTIQTGSADSGSVPYKDIWGNTLVRKRIISESDTEGGNAASRASAQLARFTSARYAIRVSTDDYDVEGTFKVGDYLWVFDPESGLVDTTNQVRFRGEVLFPVKLRAFGLSWPITEGMGVYYRDLNGVYTDLSDWVEYEEGATQIEVGEAPRNITDPAGEPIGVRVQEDPTVPGIPVAASTPWSTSSYLDGIGAVRARIIVQWTVPLNVDGSVIQDGDHYDIRYRVTGQTNWSYASVPWGTNIFAIEDLAPEGSYDFAFQAVDRGARQSGFGSTTTRVASGDTTAPSTPAVPVVTAGILGLFVSHSLGKSTGGTFNLEGDIKALNIYISTVGGFTPSSANLVGQIEATKANLDMGLAVMRYFPFSDGTPQYVKVTAVDTSGLESTPSAQVGPVSPAVVGTTQILDGAVIPSKLNVIIGGGNLVPNSSFEDGTTGWQVSNTPAATASAPVIHGTKSAKLTASVLGNMWIGRRDTPANRVAVLSNRPYVVSAFFRPDTTIRTVNLFVYEYTAADVLVNTYSSVGAQVETLGSWVRCTYVFTTGSTVEKLGFVAHVVGAAAGEIHYIDAVQVEYGDLPTAYAPKPDEILPATIGSTEIADLAIIRAKLDNLAVDSSKLEVGAVIASKIAAGAVTTEKLTVGSVSDNAVLNGSFEDPLSADATRPASWMVTLQGTGTATRINTERDTGDWCMQVLGGGGNGARLHSEYIPVVPGEQWYISCRAKVAIAIASGFYLRATFYTSQTGAVDGNNGVVDAFSNAALTTSWVLKEPANPITVPANSRWMRVQLIGWTAPAAGTLYYFDEVVARKVQVSASIADGAITTPKLVANAVTAAKIAAGTITATEMAAGAIRADKLVVGNFDNLIEDPSFEKNLGSWSPLGTNWTIVTDAANARTGNKYLYYDGTVSQANAQHLVRVPCAPGDEFYLEGWVKSNGVGSTGSVNIRIHWLNKDSGFISASSTGSISTQTTYTLASVSAVAPALAAYATVLIYTASAPTDGRTFYVDDIYLKRRIISAFIADAAIITAKIADAQITTAKIGDLQVTTAKIALANITTALIGDAQVTTLKVADANITDAKIATLTVSKLTSGDITTAILTVKTSGQIRVGRVSSPFNYALIDEAGIRAYTGGSAAFTGGTNVLDINFSTGGAYFKGTIDATAGTLTNLTVSGNLTMGTGGVIRTAASGTRLEITGAVGFSGQIAFYTGYVNETFAGSMTLTTVTTQTQRPVIDTRTPVISGRNHSRIVMYGESGDGTADALIEIIPQSGILSIHSASYVDDGVSKLIVYSNDSRFYGDISCTLDGVSYSYLDNVGQIITSRNADGAWNLKNLLLYGAGSNGNAGVTFIATSYGAAPFIHVHGPNGDKLDFRNSADTAWIPIAASQFQVNSMRKNKRDFKAVEGDAAAKLLALKPTKFRWNRSLSVDGEELQASIGDRGKGIKKHEETERYGFTVEDMLEVIPEAVCWSTGEDGEPVATGIDYSVVIALLVQAITQFDQRFKILSK